MTVSQLEPILQFLKTALFLIEDTENQFIRPEVEKCQHYNPQPSCSLSSQALNVPGKVYNIYNILALYYGNIGIVLSVIVFDYIYRP